MRSKGGECGRDEGQGNEGTREQGQRMQRKGGWEEGEEELSEANTIP